MDEIGNDRGVGNRIPCERRGASCACGHGRLAVAAASPASAQHEQHGEQQTCNDGGQTELEATSLCDRDSCEALLPDQIAHVLFQRI
jgi:hypothetical protein